MVVNDKACLHFDDSSHAMTWGKATLLPAAVETDGQVQGPILLFVVTSHLVVGVFQDHVLVICRGTIYVFYMRCMSCLGHSIHAHNLTKMV